MSSTRLLREAHVSISRGNMKLGDIPSVSFPPVLECVKCDCNKKCYAKKAYRTYKQTRSAWDRNLMMYKTDRNRFWEEVEAAVVFTSVFRFFVSGDIPDTSFFCHMVELAERRPNVSFICFTKKWEIVNSYIGYSGKELPENLHLILSHWRGFNVSNPYNLPECHVIFKDGYTTAKENKVSYYCSGNCSECFMENKGCFRLKKGEQILIKEH